MAHRHFVARHEGGEYELMSKRSWQRQRRAVPIWGFIKDGRVYAFDKIIRRNGWGDGYRSHTCDLRLVGGQKITHPSQKSRAGW